VCVVAVEHIRDLRFRLDWVIDAVVRTGEEVIIVDRDGETERAVIICMADYERLHEHADDVEARRLGADDVEARRLGAGDLGDED
jgi:antitoxin YefM